MPEQTLMETKVQRILPPLGFGIPSLLPPCVVCGEKGSGLHYGVNTCNSCKGFFYRNVSRQTRPCCTSPSHCKGAKTVRQMCSTCRFQRCVDLGMSKKAIRTGRYTYQTKTLYAEEVEKLKLQARLCKSESVLLTSDERQRELEDMVEHITTEHLKQTPTNQFFEGLAEREATFLKNQKLKKKMFGPMEPLPYTEFWSIYEETGLDLGSRRQAVIDYQPGAEEAVKRYIKFMKCLPGFKNLPIEDRVRMLKGLQFECELLTTYHIYDEDSRVWSDPFNPELMMDYEQMKSFYSRDALEDYGICIYYLQSLDLTPEEQAMLHAYLIANTDVSLSPEGCRILLAMQEVIFDAFYQLLSRNHDNHNHFLTQIISVVLKIKQTSVEMVENDKEIMSQYPDVELLPTLKAVWT